MDNSAFTDAAFVKNTAQTPQTSDSAFTDSAFAQPDNETVAKAQALSGNQDYNGWCQSFVEKIQGTPKMGGTAAEAWNNWVKQGKASADYQKAPAGSAVYFAPDASNEGAGHVAIADGKGNIIGATDNGVAKYSVADWMKTTRQQPLGYVVPK